MTPYELAALVGAATPITRPFAQRAAQLFFRLLRPATDRGAAELADWLFPENPAGADVASIVVHWKARNTALVLVRADEILADEQTTVRAVSRSWVLPLLDAVGNVEDPDLQEMWARLLAAGVAADEHQHPMWVKILAQMSAEDARTFTEVCNEADAVGRIDFTTTGPPDPAERRYAQLVRLMALDLVMPIKNADSCGGGATQEGASPWDMDLVAAPTLLGAQFRRAVMHDAPRAGR